MFEKGTVHLIGKQALLNQFSLVYFLHFGAVLHCLISKIFFANAAFISTDLHRKQERKF